MMASTVKNDIDRLRKGNERRRRPQRQMEEMSQFFKKRGYPDSAVTTGKHYAQAIDRETAPQTSQDEETNRMLLIPIIYSQIYVTIFPPMAKLLYILI